MLPPRELASSRIGLGAVPVPRIKEISGRGTFARPMPGQAAVPGQRGRQVLRSSCRDAVGGPRPPDHMPPTAYIRWHIPAQITRSGATTTATLATRVADQRRDCVLRPGRGPIKLSDQKNRPPSSWSLIPYG